ncbi:adenylate kinase [candidate division KSB1 bacterium]|nr:adenylate kinase [candidate division KSB1 bacterium]
MRAIFLGAPGTGKGTQAQYLALKYSIPQISTGDILRKAVQDGTELGKKARVIMESGQLVSDDIIIGLVKERIDQDDCKNGYLFDGFPRTIKQAESLDAMLGDRETLDVVVYFDVAEQEIIKRLTSRRVCGQCGNVYSTIYNPPPASGICEKCGGKVIHRDDDTVETVKNRLAVYEQNTAPLKAYYERQGKLRVVDGGLPVEQVRENIDAIFAEEKTYR